MNIDAKRWLDREKQRGELFIIAFQAFYQAYYSPGSMKALDKFEIERGLTEESGITKLACNRASQAVKAFDAQFPL